MSVGLVPGDDGGVVADTDERDVVAGSQCQRRLSRLHQLQRYSSHHTTHTAHSLTDRPTDRSTHAVNSLRQLVSSAAWRMAWDCQSVRK